MKAFHLGAQEPWQHLLPEFAPLSSSFVAFLFAHPDKFHFSAFSYNEDDSLFERVWANVQIARGNVLGYVYPTVPVEKGVLEERLSITWFCKALQGFDPLNQCPPRQTIANWQSRHLLRTWGFGVPEPNSASALLIMRALTSLRRYWLPSDVESDAPWFWIWGQEPGEAAPKMYPWPLPSDIAPTTCLWTTWAGAAWLPGWKGVGQYGAIAWPKTTVHGLTRWHLSLQELAAWNPRFVEDAHLVFHKSPSLPGFPMAIDSEEHQLNRLHTLADELLSRVGEPLLYRHLERFYSQRLPPVSSYSV